MNATTPTTTTDSDKQRPPTATSGHNHHNHHHRRKQPSAATSPPSPVAANTHHYQQPHNHHPPRRQCGKPRHKPSEHTPTTWHVNGRATSFDRDNADCPQNDRPRKQPSHPQTPLPTNDDHNQPQPPPKDAQRLGNDTGDNHDDCPPLMNDHLPVYTAHKRRQPPTDERHSPSPTIHDAREPPPAKTATAAHERRRHR